MHITITLSVFFQMLFGSNVKMAVQDPSYPVSLFLCCAVFYS